MPGDFPLTLSHWGTHLFNKSFLQEYLTAGQAPSRRLSSSQVLRAIEKLFHILSCRTSAIAALVLQFLLCGLGLSHHYRSNGSGVLFCRPAERTPYRSVPPS